MSWTGPSGPGGPGSFGNGTRQIETMSRCRPGGAKHLCAAAEFSAPRLAVLTRRQRRQRRQRQHDRARPCTVLDLNGKPWKQWKQWKQYKNLQKSPKSLKRIEKMFQRWQVQVLVLVSSWMTPASLASWRAWAWVMRLLQRWWLSQLVYIFRTNVLVWQ